MQRNKLLNSMMVVLPGILILAIPAAYSQTDAERLTSEDQARATWRDMMHHSSVPEEEGCFHASYPSMQWEKIECAPAPGYRSARHNPKQLKAMQDTDSAGNGYDYVAEAPAGSLFSSVVGSFPSVTGVTSEKTVNVPFGSGESDGITGTNEYTLQINTNFYTGSAACKSYKNCFSWQQYVMSTNTPVSLTSSKLTGDTEVFIEYWLINYGSSHRTTCPSGFILGGNDSPGVDCVQNTPATVIYKGQLPIKDIASLTFSGSATSGGTDKAIVTYDSEAYTASVKDSYTDIASGWTEAEFNVVGNAGGSEAAFNSGSSLTTKLALTQGSTATPTCVSPSSYAGTTGETNNLTLGSCTAKGGSAPYIQFTQSN